MRITSIGHAGLRLDTAGGSILCDPWSTPAYLEAWFPFPANDSLDWDELGECDYLYVSHLHRDHFDPVLLARHVRKTARVLLPDYSTRDLEEALRSLAQPHSREARYAASHQARWPRLTMIIDGARRGHIS